MKQRSSTSVEHSSESRRIEKAPPGPAAKRLRQLLATVCLALFALPALPASARDWARIAVETEEPAFALRIVDVRPGSQVEAIGLEVGDYIYQIGERCTAAIPAWGRAQDETLFYCRAGGEKGRAVVRRGRIGVWWATSFRPQLDYLRGEIGTSDPAWDRGVATALALLESDPAAAEERWLLARALGYPEDELHAFVQAYCAWRLGRPVPVGEAFDAVEREFSAMPHLYFAFLEEMALASGRTDLLRRLRELDPESSLVSERWLRNWELFDASPTPQRRLLEYAKHRRGRSLLDGLAVPPSEEDERLEGRLRHLLDLRRMNPDPGHYTVSKFSLPDGARDFHCSISFRLAVRGFDERWDSSVRLEAYTDEAAKERYGTGSLAQLTLIANRDGSTTVRKRGGHAEDWRGVWLHDEPIPFVGEVGDKAAPEESRPFRLDLVRLGREIAVYANGVAYAHLPIDPEVPTEQILFHAAGIIVDFTDFEVWSLSESP